MRPAPILRTGRVLWQPVTTGRCWPLQLWQINLHYVLKQHKTSVHKTVHNCRRDRETDGRTDRRTDAKGLLLSIYEITFNGHSLQFFFLAFDRTVRNYGTLLTADGLCQATKHFTTRYWRRRDSHSQRRIKCMRRKWGEWMYPEESWRQPQLWRQDQLRERLQQLCYFPALTFLLRPQCKKRTLLKSMKSNYTPWGYRPRVVNAPAGCNVKKVLWSCSFTRRRYIGTSGRKHGRTNIWLCTELAVSHGDRQKLSVRNVSV